MSLQSSKIIYITMLMDIKYSYAFKT